VLDAVADLVDAILQHCGDVRLLATSREPLRVEGERIIQVGSLDTAQDAVTLFRDRATGPGDDESTIRRICERLDGIPLAIELAAARTSHLSLDDIAERLDDRFRLLTGGRRRVQRQQTLLAALDWSHDLLTPHERKLLRSLAVFNGPIRLDALEGICGRDHDDFVAVLGSLVERSMVNHDPGERRYRLLETVRLYAQQKLLEAGDADEYRRRHRDWFLAYVCALPLEECFFPGNTSRRIATDIDDLGAAVRWSYDSGDVMAAAEITTRMAMAAVHVESQEVAAWATTLVPRLDLDSELAFRCFLAGVWSSGSTRSRETSESADLPVDAYLRRMSSLLTALIRLAEARTDDVSVFARALVAHSL
jgi:predicted ATPase